MSNAPQVSVLMLAYNHEPYIHQAIQSIMDQETEFDFEVVIGEDKSTDNTKAVIKEFINQYPNRIRLLENEANLGMHKNYLNTLFSCEGKYIALCEGDDYWINPLKLQHQFDFLEANKEFVLVCGNGKRFNHQKQRFEGEMAIYPRDSEISFKKMIRYNYITTATIMYRNVLNKDDFKESFYDIISCDWYTYLRLFRHGKFMYLSEIFSVYRENEGSINGRTNRIVIDEYEMKFLNLVKKGNIIELDDNREQLLEESIQYKFNDIAKVHAKNRNIRSALKLGWQSFTNRPMSWHSMYQLLFTLIIIISPGLFSFLKRLKRNLS